MRSNIRFILISATTVFLVGCSSSEPNVVKTQQVDQSEPGQVTASASASASWNPFQTLTPADAMRMLNSPRADQRRMGIADLSTKWDWGKHEPYLGYYRTRAHDEDYTVRAMAIRALNISRDHASTSIFIEALKDENELVRLEAAKALANLPDPSAIQPLEIVLAGTRSVITPDGHQTLTSENKDVRIAAADALRQYRTLDVARVLVSYLNETDFGVAWQSRQSLIALTGQDLQYDESAWLEYLVGPGKPFG